MEVAVAYLGLREINHLVLSSSVLDHLVSEERAASEISGETYLTTPQALKLHGPLRPDDPEPAKAPSVPVPLKKAANGL